MAYTKHNFKSGDTLYASQLNEIEDQIALNEDGVGQLSEEKADKTTVDALAEENTSANERIDKIDSELEMAANVSRNLNVTKYVNKTKAGVTATVNEDNSVTLTGTPEGGFFMIETAADRQAACFQLPAGTYTMSGDNASPYISGYVCLYPNKACTTPQQTIKSSPKGNPTTFTTTEDLYAIFAITLSKTATLGDGVTLKLQLEKGERATNYVSPFTPDMRSGRFASIENRIDDLEAVVYRENDIDYYHEDNYLANKAARVIELGKTADDIFVVITDQHWERNAKKSPYVINDLCKSCHVPRMFNLGDMADTPRQDLADMMAVNFDGDIHYVMGNHDYFRPAKGKGLAYVYDSGKPMQIGVRERHYYYVDNHQSKLRYIILSGFDEGVEGGDSWTRGFEEAQMTWLTTEALNVENGWGVLVYMHHTHHISDDRLNVTADVYAAPVLELLDENNAGGKIIAIFSGHTHIDAVMHTTGGIPIIITACDKYQAYTSGDYFDFYDDDRVLGTITEQCFDVVAIDKTTQTISLIRIGAPAYDIVDGVNSGNKLEERTVTY